MKVLEMQVNALMRLCTAERDSEREEARAELRNLLEFPAAPAADPEQEVRRILLELGAPDHLTGHPYVIEGILLALGNRMYIQNITFLLYPQLAATFDTTASRVERAIRHLIEVTWARGDYDILNRYFGNTISPDKGKPTNGEFIARLANVVRERMKESA